MMNDEIVLDIYRSIKTLEYIADTIKKHDCVSDSLTLNELDALERVNEIMDDMFSNGLKRFR